MSEPEDQKLLTTKINPKLLGKTPSPAFFFQWNFHTTIFFFSKKQGSTSNINTLKEADYTNFPFLTSTEVIQSQV